MSPKVPTPANWAGPAVYGGREVTGDLEPPAKQWRARFAAHSGGLSSRPRSPTNGTDLSEGHFCLEDQGLLWGNYPAPGKCFIKSSSFPSRKKNLPSQTSFVEQHSFIPSTNICSVPATHEVLRSGLTARSAVVGMMPPLPQEWKPRKGEASHPPEWKHHKGQNFVCSVFLAPRRRPGTQQAHNTYGLNKE